MFTAKLRANSSLLILTVVYVALLMGGGSQMRIAFNTPHDASAAAAYLAANATAIKFASFLELGIGAWSVRGFDGGPGAIHRSACRTSATRHAWRHWYRF
jgi:TctA family transporter